MYTTFGLEELQRQLASRDDEGALDCLCSEYHCECHDLVPKLVADLVKLHEVLGEIKKLVGPLPVKGWDR